MVALLVVFSPILFGGRTLSGASYGIGTNGLEPFPGQQTVGEPNRFRLDVATGTWSLEPWAQINNALYRDGELPLWNPYQGAGKPQAANLQSAPFDPLFAVVNLHPTPLTSDVTLLMAFLLGALTAFGFARITGLGRLGAVAASIIFSLAGWPFIFGNNHFVIVYVYLPVVCLLVEWVVRTGRLLAVFTLAVALASCIAVGFPEGALAVASLGGAWGVWRSVVGARVGSVRRAMVRVGGGFCLAAALASPLLLIFAEYERISFNLHKAVDRTGLGSDPVRFMLNWMFPFLNGSPAQSTSDATFSGTTDWVGAGAVFVALFGIAARTKVMREYGSFFAVVAVLLLAKFYGFSLVSWVGTLPLFQLVNFHRFWQPVAVFSIAIVAACGVDAIHRCEISLGRLVVAIALWAAAVAYLIHANWGILERIPGDQAIRQVGLGVVVVAAIVLAIRVAQPRAAGVIIVGAVICELVLIAPRSSAYALRAHPFVPPPWAVQLREDLASDPTARVFGMDGLLFPETAGPLGFYDIRMTDALYVKRYYDYIKTFVEPQLLYRFFGGLGGIGEETTPAQYAGNRMFDLLGVRYMVTRQLIDDEPSPDVSTPSTQWRLVGQDADVRIYENTHVIPRAFVATDVRVVPDAASAMSLFASESHPFSDGALNVTGIDPLQTAIVEAEAGSLQAQLTGATACRGTPEARVERYGGNNVHMTVDSPCPGVLVLSDTYYPGWTATVNGQSETIYPTDVTFRGVPVPAGHSEVTMTYAPASFRRGAIISGSAFLVLPIVWLGGRLLRRRRDAATAPT